MFIYANTSIWPYSVHRTSHGPSFWSILFCFSFFSFLSKFSFLQVEVIEQKGYWDAKKSRTPNFDQFFLFHLEIISWGTISENT